jgi:hypothetical protein
VIRRETAVPSSNYAYYLYPNTNRIRFNEFAGTPASQTLAWSPKVCV